MALLAFMAWIHLFWQWWINLKGTKTISSPFLISSPQKTRPFIYKSIRNCPMSPWTECCKAVHLPYCASTENILQASQLNYKLKGRKCVYFPPPSRWSVLSQTSVLLQSFHLPMQFYSPRLPFQLPCSWNLPPPPHFYLFAYLWGCGVECGIPRRGGGEMSWSRTRSITIFHLWQSN